MTIFAIKTIMDILVYTYYSKLNICLDKILCKMIISKIRFLKYFAELNKC